MNGTDHGYFHQPENELQWPDISIICCYLIFVLTVGLWSSLKARGGGVSGYFLAGRKMTWFLVGSSLFGSNIGSEHFVGLAGSGAASGIGIAIFELNAMFVLIILGWIFLPVYIASGVYTMPEYIKKRFGGKRIRIYLATVALLLSIFTKISADLFAGALFLKKALNWNLYAAIALLLTISCVATVSGGLRAVMWTDTTQVVIMIGGAIFLTVASFNEVGGYLSMAEKYFLAVPDSNYTYPGSPACSGIPKQDSLNLVRDLYTSDLPWVGTIFGQTVNSIWYWCADQVIVQKALSSKNYSHAKGGCVLTAVYKFFPLWLIIFPGMIARILYPNEVGCTDPSVCKKICYSANGCSNIAYPLLVMRLLPTGLRGVMVAVLMSAIMSSLSSIFNSSSTVFTIDIWKSVRKNASPLELLIVGRLFVVVMLIVAVLWIPIIANYPSSQLYVYIQSVSSYLAPPVGATFLLAVLVPRVNEKGAFWGLLVGLIMGLVRFFLEVWYEAPACYEKDTRPAILTEVHYLHYAIILFVVVTFVNITVSFLTEPIDPKYLYRLTFWTRHSTSDRISLNESEDRNETLSNLENDTPKNKPSGIRNALYCICGLNKDEQSETGTHQISEDKISLQENKVWRRITNILALIILSIALFVYSFWA